MARRPVEVPPQRRLRRRGGPTDHRPQPLNHHHCVGLIQRPNAPAIRAMSLGFETDFARRPLEIREPEREFQDAQLTCG